MFTRLALLAAASIPCALADTAVFKAAAAPSPWVTVDSNGHAVTITPTTSGSSTISAPPAALTQTGTYTLTVAGRPTTTTGLAPVASPTGSGPAGAFLACDNYQGPGSPFCQPQRGSTLYQGRSYYSEHHDFSSIRRACH
jgi:hypothetical protein